MKGVLWQKIWLPDLSAQSENISVLADTVYNDQVENVRKIEQESSDIEVPDPKAFRSMTRSSLFISSMAPKMKPFLAPFLEKSPFSVGIYCAVENGPIDGPSTAEIIKRSDESFDFKFSEAYRKLRNPKMYLKQLPNLVPAQLGISLGVQGPMNVYTHSKFGSIHALQQAEADLNNDLIEAAIVVTGHAFDDFWVVKRSRQQDPRTLCEGSAALILVKGANLSQKIMTTEKDPLNYFGVSDQLINLIKSNLN